MLAITTTDEEPDWRVKKWMDKLSVKSAKDWDHVGCDPENRVLALKSLGISLDEVWDDSSLPEAVKRKIAAEPEIDWLKVWLLGRGSSQDSQFEGPY
jgi:hypothetical protein